MSTAKSPPARSRSFASMLFSGQESGLVVVIILLGALLAIFGGNKPQRQLLGVPAGTEMTFVDTAGQESEDPLPRSRLGAVVVEEGSAAGRYEAADGWSYRTIGGEGQLLRDRSVNKFLDINNLVLVFKDASFIAIMAVGMTAVIILAGIDLSVGSIYALAALIGAMVLTRAPPDLPLIAVVPLGLLVCGAVGAVCGLANGALSVGLRVHPFVITLGTLAAYRGLVFVISDGQSITGFPAAFTQGFFKAEIGGVYPVPVLVMLAVAAVGWFVLTYAVFGRRVFAIGGNETAARYAGVPVGRVKTIVYTLNGLLAGVSACVYLGYLGAAEPNAGQGYELRVIAAAVIGGASLLGGRGSALGAVLGAIIVEMINNAMIILEIDQSYNQIVMGSAIVAAVVIDQAKTRFHGRHG